jgi:hypothetical protein
MPSTDAFALRQFGFDEFLLAPVGTEANGMALTLLSMFARAGHDPWLEAGRLAGMPVPEATESLARSIASMPSSLWPLQAATGIAARLIALLPTRTTIANQRPSAAVVKGKAGRLLSIAVILICAAFLMASEAGLFTTSAPPKPDGRTPASLTAAPGSPPGVQDSRPASAPER